MDVTAYFAVEIIAVFASMRQGAGAGEAIFAAFTSIGIHRFRESDSSFGFHTSQTKITRSRPSLPITFSSSALCPQKVLVSGGARFLNVDHGPQPLPSHTRSEPPSPQCLSPAAQVRSLHPNQAATPAPRSTCCNWQDHQQQQASLKIPTPTRKYHAAWSYTPPGRSQACNWQSDCSPHATPHNESHP